MFRINEALSELRAGSKKNDKHIFDIEKVKMRTGWALPDFPAGFFKFCHGTKMKIQVQIN